MSEGGYRAYFRRVYLRKDKTNPRRIAYVALLLFATPPGAAMMALGTVLVLAGIAFHGWAAGYLARAGYEDRETVLTLLGPYRHNRNPYYVAHLVMDLGMFCVAGLAPFYLIYGPLIFLVYRRWVLNEEPFLRREFGAEYDQMCREVPRWLVRPTPAAARGPDQRFTWSMYFFNGEHWRSGSHLLWLALFWAYWVAGNPFSALPVGVPATILAVITAHYLVYDVTPRDVSRLSPGWLLAAAAIALGGGWFVAQAPLWWSWAPVWTWLARGVALLIVATLVVSGARSLRQRDQGRAVGPFRALLMPWHLALLAAGLLSATLGGIWLAIVISLTLRALTIAGAVRIPPLVPAPARVPEER